MKHFLHKFILLIILLPFLNACGQKSKNDTIKISDQCPFKGSVTIYDNQNNRWLFSDEADAHKETLPASTFKIINSLIALEVKAVENEEEVLKWDGQEKYVFGKRIQAWESDTDLKTAFENSTVWFYIELAKKIGKEQYKKYLSKSNYGNLNLSEVGDDFWNKGLFAISPINQIRFLKALHENNLPFSQKTMDTVKDIATIEKTDEYVLRGKTGWTSSGDLNIGWWIGYVEKAENVYFFATRLTKDENDTDEKFGPCRISATKEALKQISAF